MQDRKRQKEEATKVFSQEAHPEEEQKAEEGAAEGQAGGNGNETDEGATQEPDGENGAEAAADNHAQSQNEGADAKEDPEKPEAAQLAKNEGEKAEPAVKEEEPSAHPDADQPADAAAETDVPKPEDTVGPDPPKPSFELPEELKVNFLAFPALCHLHIQHQYICSTLHGPLSRGQLSRPD